MQRVGIALSTLWIPTFLCCPCTARVEKDIAHRAACGDRGLEQAGRLLRRPGPQRRPSPQQAPGQLNFPDGRPQFMPFNTSRRRAAAAAAAASRSAVLATAATGGRERLVGLLRCCWRGWGVHESAIVPAPTVHNNATVSK